MFHLAVSALVFVVVERVARFGGKEREEMAAVEAELMGEDEEGGGDAWTCCSWFRASLTTCLLPCTFSHTHVNTPHNNNNILTRALYAVSTRRQVRRRRTA